MNELSMSLPEYLEARLRQLYIEKQRIEGAIAEVEALAKMATPAPKEEPVEVEESVG